MLQEQLNHIHFQQVIRKQSFQIGDTVRVHYNIREGSKSRIQIYEGVVIAINNKGVGKSFIVRKISYGVGVERIFPLYCPNIDKIEVVRSGKVRRAKLYYLRERVGKATKLTEVKKPDFDDKLYIIAQEYLEKEKSETQEPVVEEVSTSETNTNDTSVEIVDSAEVEASTKTSVSNEESK